MIERLMKNPLTLKRYRRFKSLKRSVVATWLFFVLLFVSITAEFWANSTPIVLHFSGHTYFPALKHYSPELFGQMESVVTNYRTVIMGEKDWAVWPLVGWDPFESNKNVETYPSGPSFENWLGTDDRGRDVLSRLIYGFRYSFVFAIFVWFGSYVVGIFLGAIMGYLGGTIDLVGQRLVEIFESVPTLLLLITLISIFGASLDLLVLFSVIFGWMLISVYMRAEFLKLRHREFVDSSRALGASHLRVIFKHVLPNALGPILTFSSFTIAGGIASLAALDYLGFGLPPPTPSWGELLNQAHKHFEVAWWLATFPSLALFLSLVVLNLIGEGVRDAFDPRRSV